MSIRESATVIAFGVLGMLTCALLVPVVIVALVPLAASGWVTWAGGRALRARLRSLRV